MKQALKVARCKTIIEDHGVSGDGGNRTTFRGWPGLGPVVKWMGGGEGLPPFDGRSEGIVNLRLSGKPGSERV